MKSHPFYSKVALLCLILLTSIKVTSQTLNPDIPGSYDVTPGGAFAYTVPLRIPPGICSMMPELALTYSSQSGNSTMGVGWSLAGLSAISRTNASLYHHSGLDHPRFLTTDNYALDGQPLYKETTGYYMTWIKNYANISAIGTAGNGPDHWLVETPAGLTMEYGNTTGSSRMLAQGRSEAITWAINKITDINGNYITFEYYNNQPTGEYRISKITYTGTTTPVNLPQSEILFNYTPRTDKNRTWLFASILKDEVILDNIEIKQAGTLVNKYKFTYAVNDYSHLTKIEETRGGVSASPINITWGSGTSVAAGEVVTSNSGIGNSKYAVGDFDGDGSSDYVGIPDVLGSPAILDLYMYKKNGIPVDGEFVKTPVTASYSGGSSKEVYSTNRHLTMDYNGDGFDDLIVIQTSGTSTNASVKIYVHISNGVTLSPGTLICTWQSVDFSASLSLSYVSEVRVLTGDFDGDGKGELYILTPNIISHGTIPLGHGAIGYYGSDYFAYVVGDEYASDIAISGSTGTILGNFKYVQQIQHALYLSNVLDFNGDGKDDILLTWYELTNPTECQIWTMAFPYTSLIGNQIRVSGSSSPTPVLIYSSNFPSHYYEQLYTGDFNGDGKDDMFTWVPDYPLASHGTWEISYSMGGDGITTQGFDASSAASPLTALSGSEPFFSSTQSINVGDFNGDGKSDILKLNGTLGSTYEMFYSTGYKSFTYESSSTTGISFPNAIGRAQAIGFGDFNGDGQLDVLCHHRGSPGATSEVLYFHKNESKHIVSSITSGIHKVDITTGSTAQISNYVNMPITGLGYPYIKKRIPIKVALEVFDNSTSVLKMDSFKSSVINLVGLGFMGFKATIATHNLVNQKEENYYRNTDDAYSPMPFLENWYKKNAASGKLIARGTSHPDNNNGGCANRVRNITPSYSEEYDTSVGLRTTKQFKIKFAPGTLGYIYGAPDSVIETNGPSITKTSYSYPGGTPAIYIAAKPISSTTYTVRPSQTPYIRTTNYGYDPQGRLSLTTIDPSTLFTKTITYTYNTIGNITKTRTSAASISPDIEEDYFFTSDNRFINQHTKHTNPTSSINIITTFGCNLWGDVTSQVSLGISSISTYDLFGRLQQHTLAPRNIITNYQYDLAAGLPDANPDARTCIKESVVGITGSDLTFYDLWGNTSRTVSYGRNGKKIYQDKSYTGRILNKETLPYDATGSGPVTLYYNYDNFGRLWKTNNTASATDITRTYNVLNSPPYVGLETTVLNSANAYNKVIKMDESGAILKVTDNTSFIDYTYKSNGKVASTMVNGDAALTTTFAYDDCANLKTLVEPDAGTKEYVYDALGRMTIKKDYGIGTLWTYNYDALNRTTSFAQQTPIFGGTPQTYTNTYVYPSNQPSDYKLSDESGPYFTSRHYQYDPIGDLIQVDETEGANTFTTRYTYDSKGRERTHQFPNSDLITRSYDGYGFLQQINLTASAGLPPQILWSADDDDNFGNVTKATCYNNANSALYNITKGFDPLGGAASRLVKAGGTTIADAKYTFDMGTGNLSSRKDNLRGFIETFTNDAQDRLTKTVYTGLPASLSDLNTAFNAKGNIIHKSDVSTAGPVVLPWIYNTSYALSKVPLPATSNPTYTIPTTPQGESYYPFGKVQNISENGETYDFNYWPDGERSHMFFAMSGVPKLTRYYATDFERTVIALGGPTQDVNYVNSDEGTVAILKHKTGPGAMDSIYYVVDDHLGSITHLLDDYGNVVEERSFDAWGRPRNPLTYVPYVTATMPNWILDRGYTGHEHILRNHIINMNGRLYDPLIGRMYSPDPDVCDISNSGCYNKYSYVNNNPLRYTDPTGNTFGIDDGIACAIGGVINVAMNWNSITSKNASFGEGLLRGVGYFTVGAASGWVSYYAGPVVGAGIQGAGNAGLSGLIKNGKVDLYEMGQQGAISALVGGVSSVASKQLTPVVSNILAPVRSPVGQQVLIQGTVGSVTGAASGGVIAAVSGTNVWEGVKTGAELGFLTGAALGVYEGVRIAREKNLNAITGRMKRSPQVGEAAKAIKRHLGKGWKLRVNKKGDVVMWNKENTKKFRIDLNNYDGATGPHMHLEHRASPTSTQWRNSVKGIHWIYPKP